MNWLKKLIYKPEVAIERFPYEKEKVTLSRPAISYPGEVKSMLLIKLDRIGDVLLTLPAFKSLREAFPKAKITYLISPLLKELVELLPFHDEIITFDFFNQQRRKVSSLLSEEEKKQLGKIFHNREFDLAINLRPFSDTREFLLLSPARYKAGIKEASEKSINKKQHILKQIGDICQSATNKQISEGDFNLKPFLTLGLKEYANKILSSLKGKIIGFHPSAGTPSKTWPKERFALLADRLIEQLGASVFFISEAEEHNLKIIKLMKHKALNLSGLALPQAAAVIEKADLFISTNSGPMHLAAAVKTKTIGLFSGESLPLEWGPYGIGNLAIFASMRCAPCHLYQCPKKTTCMDILEADTVLETAKHILS